MSGSKEFAAILQMNLLSHGQRPGLAATIVFGVTCAVAVLVAMLAMGAGARSQTMSDIRDDRVIVVSKGAQSAMQSAVPKGTADMIPDVPGIRLGANGKPIAIREALVMVEARRKADLARINFPLYGVSPGLTELRPELQLTAGRLFQPGLHEIIASDVCAREYVGFLVGDTHSIRGSDWRIVGHFSTGHTGGMCKLYADADSVMSAFNINNINQVTVMLQSAEAFNTFQAALAADPRLRLEVKRERDVIAQESQQVTGILDFASYFIGAIMAIGATLGAVNSLYAIVDSRRRELATLRAIGFRSPPIIASIIVESIVLALPGALLGAAVAWIGFDGLSASPNGVSFHLAVTPALVTVGILWALCMGLIGGFPPALRAARMPITNALRAT